MKFTTKIRLAALAFGLLAAAPILAATPTLNLDIPTVKFSEISAGGGTVTIPWLAEYVTGLYKYAIGAAGLLAVVMMMYGGVRWLTAGGDASVVSTAKEHMRNAAVGLVLVLGAYVLLYAVSPDLVSLKSITIQTVERQTLEMQANTTDGGSGGPTGPDLDAAAANPPEMDIPRECPKRTSNDYYAVGAMGEAQIQFWLEDQKRNGIPAAVTIAQMLTEAGDSGKCAARNPLNVKEKCRGQVAQTFNFGGVSCTGGQVPSGCGQVGYVSSATIDGTTTSVPGLTCDQVNKTLGSKCVEICEASGGDRPSAANYDCGQRCYPQPSYHVEDIEGKKIHVNTIQCSLIYPDFQSFLNEHARLVKFCLPYNDSAYKFAYCIGAINYASAPDKASALAAIIEKNCLCDPTKDASGCQRNIELENRLKSGRIPKTNVAFFRHKCLKERAANGYCPSYDMTSGVDYAGLVKTLRTRTGGLLDTTPAKQ